MKYIILLIVLSISSLRGLATPTDSLNLRDINQMLAKGLYYYKKSLYLDSVSSVQKDIISLQQRQIESWEYRYVQKEKAFNFADSNYNDVYQKLQYSNSEVDRLKVGKRNWKYSTIGIIAGAAIYIFFSTK